MDDPDLKPFTVQALLLALAEYPPQMATDVVCIEHLNGSPSLRLVTRVNR